MAKLGARADVGHIECVNKVKAKAGSDFRGASRIEIGVDGVAELVTAISERQ